MTIGFPHRPALAGDSLERALELMADNDTDYLPVIDDPATRRIVGMVQKSDILIAHNRALMDDRDAVCSGL